MYHALKVKKGEIVQWALISVLLSGLWDSGLRYQTYKECFEFGVQASFKETVAKNKESIELNGKTFPKDDISIVLDWKRRNHEGATMCVPVAK